MSGPESLFALGVRTRTSGTTLVELMVGLSLASLAIAAAIACLLVARNAAATVSELAALQQQTSHALRVLGAQIRPAGSAELQSSGGDALRYRFAMQTSGEALPAAVSGTDGDKGASDSLQLLQTSPPLMPSQQRDCLGQKVAAGVAMKTSFAVTKGSLRCQSLNQTQPLVAGVTAFKLRYRVRQGDQVRVLSAGEVTAGQLWPAVTALEVCLDLHGTQINRDTVRQYTNCTGTKASTEGRPTLVTRKLFVLKAAG